MHLCMLLDMALVDPAYNARWDIGVGIFKT